MLRPLTIRLNPQTVSWAASFALLEVGIASCLAYFGVGGGLTLGWLAAAAAVFAACEPGFFAWLWAVLVARDEGAQSPRKKATKRQPPESATSEQSESPGEDAAKPGPNDKIYERSPRREYEEELAKVIGSRSHTLTRVSEVIAAVILAALTMVGSHWMPGKMPPPEQAALQHTIDQLRSDLKKCEARTCGTDNSGGGGFDNNSPTFDPKFKQDILDAIKAAAQPPDTFWTGSTFLGVSALALLIIAVAVALVFVFRKRPETAAPLGAVGLAAAAIKEAEHLSRIDTYSFHVALWFFVILLTLFALLAALRIFIPEPVQPTPVAGEKDKAKAESPLSLMFSALVLLWALLAICYRQEHPPAPPPPTPSVHEKPVLGYRVLPSIPGFASGRSDRLTFGKSLPEVAHDVVQEARDQGAKPDDMLVLLGSADCTSVRQPKELSNQALARNRATGLKNLIDSLNQFLPNHVEAESLHQGETCTGSADLRAVFPVLIKQENAGAADRY